MSLLLDHGADIDAGANNDITALMMAIDQGQFDAMKLLVERKADLHARDVNKCTGTDAYNQAQSR